jgi:hypothetical protein
VKELLGEKPYKPSIKDVDDYAKKLEDKLPELTKED